MTELINKAGAILEKSAQLIKIPAVSGAVDSLFGWLGNIFSNKKSAQEKLELVKQNIYSQETISGLKANLEFVLEDNEELRKQLETKISELSELAEKAGIQNVTKTNTMNLSGNGNISLQDINGGNISINK